MVEGRGKEEEEGKGEESEEDKVEGEDPANPGTLP
jgi:hypothetical protein